MSDNKPIDTAPFDCDAQSVGFVERMLQQAEQQRDALSPAWQAAMQTIGGSFGNGPLKVGPSFLARSLFDPAGTRDVQAARFQQQVDGLVEAYRRAGHRAAAIDPLGLLEPDTSALELDRFGLSKADLTRRIPATDFGDGGGGTLGELLDRLRATYCGAIAYQFSHIHDPDVREWMLDRVEGSDYPKMSSDRQRHVLKRLVEAEVFDSYLRKKHPGAKTFSLEGAEALIVILDSVIEQSAADGVQEVVMGVTHRGRLNVLANIVGKPASAIFRELRDEQAGKSRGKGDVRYHLGASGDRQTRSGVSVHVSLCFNPSHLEFVDPLVLGRLRAKQDRTGDERREKGLAVLVHGEAAFVGEGIVQETLNLSQLPDYEVGGALHIIVNNQVGFTTPPEQGRSMPYAADVACMLQVPILRVHGEHLDAVIRAATLALEFRREFHRDVVIDLICYRRWGHNEGDEPSFTQPLMYQAIEHKLPLREMFAQELVEQGVVSAQQVDELVDSVTQRLRTQYKPGPGDGGQATGPSRPTPWKPYRGGPEPQDDEPDTAIEMDLLQRCLEHTTELPEGFHLHKKLRRSFEQRQQMARGDQPLDWAAAEALAFASLAEEGRPVRLAGQDAVRGTFSQRHAVLHDVVDGHTHSIFAAREALDSREAFTKSNNTNGHANVQIINSPLSEAAAMAFEYGYSLDHPQTLVLWEAQFGDFVNAAQVIVDQFLSSAEDKWNRWSGLVLLLPHGFEGQGPEHSSARLERFLTLAAEDNLQIVQPSTPAQYFHCLRRQALRRWRKPLVMLTPKSLLRRRDARSPREEFANGSFQRVIPEHKDLVRRLLLCSGKIYYDLHAARQERGRDDIAIARVEQFYPLGDSHLEPVCASCNEDTRVFWVQDEPANMGAAPYWTRRFGDRFLGRYRWKVIARRESASPATGSKASHQLEEERLIARAFGEDEKQRS